MTHAFPIGPDEDTASGLLTKLAALDREPAQSWQLDIVRTHLEFYAEMRVLDLSGRALPLSRDCQHCSACWSRVTDDRKPADRNCEISVPYVGGGYRSARILVVGINAYNEVRLGTNWWHARGHIHERLALRARGWHQFAYQVGCHAALISMSLQRCALPDELTRSDAAGGWRSSALVEAVKCAPASDRGRPEPAMWRNCPPTYLHREIELLCPRVIVATGRQVESAVISGLHDATLVENRPPIRRYRATAPDESSVELFAVLHPNGDRARRSVEAVRGSLRAMPLPGA